MKIKGLIYSFGLVCRYISLLTNSLGPSWGPEALAFLTSKYVSSYYSEHFLLKFQNNFT